MSTISGSLSSEETAFRLSMKNDFRDADCRLVFADWLEEHGRTLAARRLRWWAALLPHLIEPRSAEPPEEIPTDAIVWGVGHRTPVYDGIATDSEVLRLFASWSVGYVARFVPLRPGRPVRMARRGAHIAELVALAIEPQVTLSIVDNEAWAASGDERKRNGSPFDLTTVMWYVGLICPDPAQIVAGLAREAGTYCASVLWGLREVFWDVINYLRDSPWPV